MENYISTVLSKIENEKVKADIQAELEDHYNERVEYYTRIGYDKETAEAKANEHFGEDAEIVGEQIDNINTRSVATSVIFICITALFFWGIIFLTIGWLDFGASFSCSFVGIVLFLLYLSFSLIEIAVGLKNKSRFQTTTGFLGIFELAVIYKGFSSVFFCIQKLISGDGGKLLDLLWNYNWKSANTVINVLGTLFIIFCIGLQLYAVYLIQRFERCEYRKRHIRQEKVLKITAVIVAVLLLILLVAIFVTPTKYGGKYVRISEFYVIESDEMVDPATVEDYDRNCLELDFERNNPYYREPVDSFVDSELFNEYMNEFDDDADVLYNTYIMYVEFQPTKHYVCVVPVTGIGNIPDFKNSEWYDTTNETLIVSDIYNTNGSLVQYKVKVLPRENGVEE